MDRLLLHGMVFFGHHGAGAAEREVGQRFVVDVELEADLRPAGMSDSLADTVDYPRAYEAVRLVVEGQPQNLLESVAEQVAERMLRFPPVQRATVRVSKKPPIGGEFRAFAVEVRRTR
jgi:dihydroneopterin aldolase